MKMADAYLGKDLIIFEIVIGIGLCFGNLFLTKVFRLMMTFGWEIRGQLRKENSCSENIAVITNAVELNDLRLSWKTDSISILNKGDEKYCLERINF